MEAVAETEREQALEKLELETVFREHHALVFRAACRVTGNAADAEDVLQTVFLRLVRRDGSVLVMKNVESYLYRAAVNVALDLVRTRDGARGVPLDEVVARTAERSLPAPDRVYAAGEIRDWLRAAVARLHPTAAEIFVLRFFEGRQNSEIATMLGATPGTVAVTLHRAREKLLQEFQSFWGGSHET